MRTIAFGTIVLVWTGSLAVSAQTAPPTPAAPAQPPEQDAAQSEVMRFNLTMQELSGKLRQIEESGNLLAELQGLQSIAAEYAGNDMALQVIRTLLAQRVMSSIGDYAGAHRCADLVDGPPTARPGPSPASALDGYKPESALQAIVAAAENRQAVMINEAHHVPQHRAFTLELLVALREKGFNYFAAETLHPDRGLAERRYPTKETGSYIREPLYGDLVRAALRLGYQVVPYESETIVLGREPEARERDQAQHLSERIFQKDPKARVLVLAGYGHISEESNPKMMAAFFKEKTGIDPLTVNQQAMTEHSSPEFEEPVYRWAVQRGLVSEPVVFRNAAGSLWSSSKALDMAVFHPRSLYESGRPTWLQMGGLRSPSLLPAGVCGPAPRCLVKARPVNEGTDAIPIDQIIVEAGKPAPALMLPKGSFVIRVEDAKGNPIGERTQEH